MDVEASPSFRCRRSSTILEVTAVRCAEKLALNHDGLYEVELCNNVSLPAHEYETNFSLPSRSIFHVPFRHDISINEQYSQISGTTNKSTNQNYF